MSYVTRKGSLFFIIPDEKASDSEEATEKAKSEIEKINSKSKENDSVGTIKVNIDYIHKPQDVSRDYNPQFDVTIEFKDDKIDDMSKKGIINNNFNKILGTSKNLYNTNLDQVVLKKY